MMISIVTQNARSATDINLNREALKKYLTKCEQHELAAFETDVALANCLKECEVSWFQTKTFMLSTASVIFLTGILLGLDSK